MYIVLKRVSDFFTAFIALLLLSPFLVIITILLLIANKGKPFFFQKRPGKNEKIFTIVKFKTMNDGKDEVGNLLPDDRRLTKIGKFVRLTSLDELPQLFNVLIGDMSLIGPRPLLPQYLSLYSEFQKRRHLVQPGITGWAQVNGRNAISWTDKFNYDVYYVEHISLGLDLKILFRTIKKVFKGADINASDSITMTAFKGNNE